MSGDESMRSFDDLLQRVEPGATLVSAEPLAGGSSSGMTLLRTRRDGGELDAIVVRRPSAWALSIDANAALNEFRILETMHRAGIPVPEPLLFVEGDTAMLVLRYVEGAPDFRAGMPPRMAEQMGRLLARIHAIEQAPAGLAALPRLAAQVEAKLSGTAPGVDDRLLAAIRARWPFPTPARDVLLHGDFWPGNLLWRDGKIAAVIDWEDAVVGDPVSDLAIARLDTVMILGRDAMDDLTRAYSAAAQAELGSLPLWDLWAAVRMQSYLAWTTTFDAEWTTNGRPDITEAFANQCVARFADEALRALGQTPARP